MTELSHDEDGFHEIQLSGKQLVFLFMATTVVSVVIFLCGVLVGRGVRGDTVSAAEATTASAPAPEADAGAAAMPPVTSDAPPPATDPELTYHETLEREKRSAELKAAAPPKPTPTPPPAPAPAPVVEPRSAAPAPAETAPAAAAKPPPPPPAAPGTWAVQVVALSNRAAADAVVRRLVGKGYQAFLVAPQAGAPVQSYKVQVGRFNDRAEAEKMKLRLKRDEQFEPIVLR